MAIYYDLRQLLILYTQQCPPYSWLGQESPFSSGGENVRRRAQAIRVLRAVQLAINTADIGLSLTYCNFA